MSVTAYFALCSFVPLTHSISQSPAPGSLSSVVLRHVSAALTSLTVLHVVIVQVGGAVPLETVVARFGSDAGRTAADTAVETADPAVAPLMSVEL